MLIGVTGAGGRRPASRPVRRAGTNAAPDGDAKPLAHRCRPFVGALRTARGDEGGRSPWVARAAQPRSHRVPDGPRVVRTASAEYTRLNFQRLPELVCPAATGAGDPRTRGARPAEGSC